MSNNGKHSQTIGTRAQVWHGTAKKTPGGLTKSDLMKNKSGRIVSRAKHNTAKKEMRLVKYGYGTKKGKFGFVKIGSKKHRSRKMKGGYTPLSPAGVDDDYMLKDVVPQVFSPLDRALVGGRRRKTRGGAPYGNNFSPANITDMTIDGSGFSGSSLSASGIDGQGITDYGTDSNDVQFAAGQAGGRRRRMRGGAPYGSDFSPAEAMAMGITGLGVDGQGITDYGSDSNDVQFAAGQAGGRRRRRRSRKH
jgi:hypothetical protein